MSMEITEYELVADVNKEYNFAVPSDLHDKPFDSVIGEIARRAPDAVLIPGDVVDGHAHTAELGFAFLSEVTRIAPTFMSLGNHERHAIPETKRAAADAGVTLLDNEYADFAGIHIGGLTSAFISDEKEPNIARTTPEPNLEFLNRFAALDGCKLLLSHHPEYYPRYIKNLDIDIILSGHAHGGQWIFFGKAIFAPGQGFFPKYTSGVHDGRLVVSRGLANNAPVPRLFNRPELIFLKLVPRDRKQAKI